MSNICLFSQAVTWSGGTVYVSTNPGDCVAGQTSTAKTTDGGTAVLTPYCKSKKMLKYICYFSKLFESKK
jgi:hypothetical protein